MTKQECIDILRGRVDESLIDRDYPRLHRLVDAMNLVESGKIIDYSFLEDFGLRVTMDLPEHRLIEEQEDGSNIITHYQGDKKWITKE